MKCYICQSSDFKERQGSVRENKDLFILECEVCGLVQLSSHEHLHEEHYKNSGMHGKEIDSMEVWANDTAEDDERRFEMLRNMLPNQHVLDFGCGNGGFLMHAKKLAKEVVGVEPELRVQNHLQGHIKIYHNLSSVARERDFDLITAFHVIEHLPDPRSILLEMREVLSPQGRIVIEVPSSSDALLTLYECEPFAHFTYWSQHLYLFNASTLERLVQHTGLSLIAVKQYQRYPLSNHLYWLNRGKPGGHQHWDFLDSPQLQEAYANSLASIGKSDTLIAWLEKE
jgi:2-polyprenyl-3-methyl-5-hydroxy-6-metoxy-1,4-benzoquinol methylase